MESHPDVGICTHAEGRRGGGGGAASRGRRAVARAAPGCTASAGAEPADTAIAQAGSTSSLKKPADICERPAFFTQAKQTATGAILSSRPPRHAPVPTDSRNERFGKNSD
jgi:hypothetical protein